MTSSPDDTHGHTGDPRLGQVENRLLKGAYLKGDERSLARILEDDAAEVARLGMDLEEITTLMNRFYELGRKAFGDPVRVDDTYEVTVREDRGILACPWGDRFAARKAMVDAINLRTGRTLKFSILAWHMIREHRFFQGKDSPFRIDPEQLAAFFRPV